MHETVFAAAARSGCEMRAPMTIIPFVHWMRQFRPPRLAAFGKVLLPAALVLTAIALAGAARAAEVRFTDSPVNAQQAWETLFDRREKVTRFMACGNEFEFLTHLREIAEKPGSGLPQVIGKMLWLLFNPNTPAGGRPEPTPSGGVVVKHHDDPYDVEIYQADPDLLPFTRIQMTTPLTTTPAPYPGADCESPADVPPEIKTEALDGWINDRNAELAAAYDVPVILLGCKPPFCVPLPPHCQGMVVRQKDEKGIPIHGAKFVITPACMRLQINLVLSRISSEGRQVGTEGSACHIIGKSKGDWDVVVRDLTRVVYLNMRNSERFILFEDVATYVSDQLLTLSGPPGPTSYSLFECGNTENSTGTPLDRAAERSWLDDTLDSIGDIFDWLWKRLALLVVVLAILGLLAGLIAALPAGLGAIVAATVAVIGTMVAFGRVPETENHLLMIETSRYLKNQEMIVRLHATRDDASRYEGDQIFIKDFLMIRFQNILKNDFVEFNSRPYSRYSLLAVQNIAQFADDPELQDAANMVLQFSMAKFAIGSNRGRRLVPYRRHMDWLDKRSLVSLFDNVENGDHLIPMMMFFTGQTQHLHNNSVPLGEFGHMIYYASGMMGPNPLRPDNIIMEAAIEKSRRYEQRINHAGAEIYSGGDGWLVSAGGIETGPAYSFIVPVDLIIKKLYKDDDLGAAWPTTLFLASSAVKELFWEDQKPLQDFIRIEGLKLARDAPAATFEGNLCVGQGFACGFNLELPPPFDGSLQGCGDVRGSWTFFDTDKCYPTTVGRPGATRTFIAVFRETCPMRASGKCRTWGLFEVISFNDRALEKFAPEQRFENFIQLVLENKGLEASAGSVLSSVDTEANGTYRTVKLNSRGERISIRYQAEISESSSLARIVSIDGVEPGSKFADGDFINVDSNDRVVIGWRGDPRRPLTLDLSNYVPLAQRR
jgi:hypothetical protein